MSDLESKLRPVVSIVGMQVNPDSLLHRAAFQVESHDPGSAQHLRHIATQGGLTLEEAIEVLEAYGFHVIGHVQSLDKFHNTRFDLYDDPAVRVQVEFRSTVQSNAYVTLTVPGPEVGDLVRDFHSSGHWVYSMSNVVTP